jgi:acetyltransferase
MITVRAVASPDASLLIGLCDLLIDSVAGGASVGFLGPMRRETAARYWEGVFQSLGKGLLLWVAEEDGKVIGSAQLALCEKENGRHRADVQKLLVHSAHRGKRVASELMRELEGGARAAGRTLLVLDTHAGSLAESVYRHFGWQKVGEIPGYAGLPDGTLIATAYYYKAIER